MHCTSTPAHLYSVRIKSIYFTKLSLTCFVCDQACGTYSQHLNCKHFISFLEQGMQLSKSGLIVNAIQKKVLVLIIEIAVSLSKFPEKQWLSNLQKQLANEARALEQRKWKREAKSGGLMDIGWFSRVEWLRIYSPRESTEKVLSTTGACIRASSETSECDIVSDKE